MERLNVLIVEDQQSDAELIVAELRRAGFAPTWRRVDGEAEYVQLLDGLTNGQAVDIILADYNLPQFTGTRALQILRDRGLGIPFILISGTVGEDVAVESIKLGAADYLLKDRLVRLGPAVRQALEQRALRESRRRAETALLKRNRELAALNEVGHALAALGTPDEILDRVFAKIGDVLDNRNTYIALYDEANRYVSFPIYAIEGERQTRSGRPFANGLTEYVLRTRAPLCLNHDVTQELAARGIDLVGRRAASVLVVPMLAGDRVIGVIGLQDYTWEGVFAPSDVELLSTFAAQAAIALANAQLFDDARRHSRHQRALNTVIAAASDDDVDRGLAVALGQMLDALELDTGAIWLGQRSTTQGFGNEAATEVDRVTRDAAIERSLGDVIIEDWAQVDPSAITRLYGPLAARARVRATLAVPIFSGEQRIGAVAAFSHDPRCWRGEEIALVRSVARELGTATERRWAQQRILQQLESLTTLYASAKKLSESLSLEDLTDYVVRTAVDSFGVRAAAVRRASPDGTFALLATHPPGVRHHRQAQIRWDEGPGSLGPGAEALRSGLPSVVNDVSGATDIPADRLAALQRDGIRSAMSLPLIARDKPFGVLSLYSETVEFFRPARVEHFQAFANLVAGSLENARLFDAAQSRLDQLQALRDIDTAISGSLDARVTMNIFLDKATSRLGVDAADILLLNSATQTLEYVADRGFRTPATRQIRLRLGTGLAGQAALERRTVAVPDLSAVRDRALRSALVTGEGFVAYFGVPLIAKGEVRGVLEVFHRRPLRPDPEWMDFLSTLAGQAAIALESATMFDNLQRANTDMTLAYDTTLEGWSRALDLRDKETEGHTQRVTELTVGLARIMGMSDDELVHVRRGALLHDIGKMGIPDSILLKPGPLTDSEWEIMRRHPVYAHDLLSPILYLQPALAIPYAHHEKWDGTGYPRGLAGEAIKLEARIFAVVDVWDALTSDRPYRPAWSKEKARAFIQEQSGRHFDPAVVETFLGLNL